MGKPLTEEQKAQRRHIALRRRDYETSCGQDFVPALEAYIETLKQYGKPIPKQLIEDVERVYSKGYTVSAYVLTVCFG